MTSLLKFSTFVKTVLLGAAFAVGAVQMAEARDSALVLPVDPVLGMSGKDGDRLDGTIKFYFGATVHPKVTKTFGNFATNKKTNSFGKSDNDACNWAMLSALLALQERAKNEGGNAVVNIVSNYKKQVKSYDKEFECHAGAFVTGVALKGDVVTIK
ncbi:MAG: excinuclease ATPase subunit [Pseudomonadota bacterium]